MASGAIPGGGDSPGGIGKDLLNLPFELVLAIPTTAPVRSHLNSIRRPLRQPRSVAKLPLTLTSCELIETGSIGTIVTDSGTRITGGPGATTWSGPMLACATTTKAADAQTTTPATNLFIGSLSSPRSDPHTGHPNPQY